MLLPGCPESCATTIVAPLEAFLVNRLVRTMSAAGSLSILLGDQMLLYVEAFKS